MVKLLHMEGAGQPDQTVDRLFEQIKIINRMVVPNITEFRLIGSDKSEDDPVCLVDPEAPDLMMLGVQFLGMKRRVEGIAFEQVRFGSSFPLDGGRQFLKEPIECGGS
ncbi:MAG: hypothetical protein FIA90_06135 [candidate division NC10 bacterium]|nr:hypothetical protein [Candidatus Methylomirabilis sp.]NJD68221.1 hypothetical protein [candidate division NC10 bacterium]